MILRAHIHCVTPEAAPASALVEITLLRSGHVTRPTANSWVYPSLRSHIAQLSSSSSRDRRHFRLNPGTAGLDDHRSVGFLFTNGHYLPELAFSSRSSSLVGRKWRRIRLRPSRTRPCALVRFVAFLPSFLLQQPRLPSRFCNSIGIPFFSQAGRQPGRGIVAQPRPATAR